MYEQVKPIAGVLLDMEEDLKREFETRIAETSTLAFRVAFAVLKNSADAEDVAQDAFAKAYRSFRQLRNRDRFRAWLVRMTWRLALDRRRADLRRLRREDVARPSAIVAPLTERNERSELLWQAIDRLSEKL